jgi:hypothetical protein
MTIKKTINHINQTKLRPLWPRGTPKHDEKEETKNIMIAKRTDNTMTKKNQEHEKQASQTCPFHVYVFLQHFNNVFKVKC